MEILVKRRAVRSHDLTRERYFSEVSDLERAFPIELLIALHANFREAKRCRA